MKIELAMKESTATDTRTDGSCTCRKCACKNVGYSERWLEHFRSNQDNRPEPDWNAPITLDPATVQRLVRSIEQFELGDGGGPDCLIAWNAPRFHSGNMRELVDLWFKEEKEHSRLLGRLVTRFGGVKIESHWSFTAFCLSRRIFGVGFELTVLLLTEIVSTAYYRLLLRHGADAALRAVCKLILRDEAGHIAFHRDRLARTSRRFGPLWEARLRLLALCAGTMLWTNHADGLNAIDGSRAEFYQEIRCELTRFVDRLRTDAQMYARS
jgi:hypothetical protein